MHHRQGRRPVALPRLVLVIFGIGWSALVLGSWLGCGGRSEGAPENAESTSEGGASNPAGSNRDASNSVGGNPAGSNSVSSTQGGDRARGHADMQEHGDRDPLLLVAAPPLELTPIECASVILIEPTTNTILYEQNAHAVRAPASIVKLTLELVVLEEIAAGRLALTDSIRTSAWASRIGGSQAYLAEGEVFTLEELLHAIVVSSANDACVAVAEHVAGTAEAFVALMNREVEHLGLRDTRYVNVHGLDDDPTTGNVTTAYDIAQIGRAVIRHPHVLEWSSIEKAPFRDGTFILENTNKLVGRFEGLDGLKTGYTTRAGFCLCATAERRGLRFISVVMGCESNRDRFTDTAELLSAAFNSYSLVDLAQQGADIEGEVQIEGGAPKLLRPVAPRDVAALITRSDERRLQRRFVPKPALRAPLREGDEVGVVELSSGDRVLGSFPVVTPVDVRATGFLAWVRGIFSPPGRSERT